MLFFCVEDFASLLPSEMGNDVRNVVTFGPCPPEAKDRLLKLLSCSDPTRILMIDPDYGTCDRELPGGTPHGFLGFNRGTKEETLSSFLKHLEDKDETTQEFPTAGNSLELLRMLFSLFGEYPATPKRIPDSCFGDVLADSVDAGHLEDALRHTVIFWTKNFISKVWLRVLSFAVPGVAIRHVYADDNDHFTGIQVALDGDLRVYPLANTVPGTQLRFLLEVGHPSSGERYHCGWGSGDDWSELIDRSTYMEIAEEETLSHYKRSKRPIPPPPPSLSAFMSELPSVLFNYPLDSSSFMKSARSR